LSDRGEKLDASVERRIYHRRCRAGAGKAPSPAARTETQALAGVLAIAL